MMAPAFTGGTSSPRSCASASSWRGVRPVLSSIASRYAWNDMDLLEVVPVTLAGKQVCPLRVLVEPLADVPAHGNDPVGGVLFDVVDGELDDFAGQALPAVDRVRVRVVKRDLVAVDAVVSSAEQLLAVTQGVASGIRLVCKFLGHDSILGRLPLA